jgi:mono/diheme cytochrome c family protein
MLWVIRWLIVAGSFGVAVAAVAAQAVQSDGGAEAAAGSAEVERTEVERGHYLTRIGNCAGCHTADGGEPFAGGRRLESDFGTFFTPNITPDEATGIGDWSAEEFWNALHNGERADGSALYPACPYPSFTLATREDVDALYAYLRSIEPVRNETRGHDLGFPYSMRSMVPMWQWLHFEPGESHGVLAAADDGRSEHWQRGRYLVEGMGHCNDCHRARGRLGALSEEADAPGAMIHEWYAPALTTPNEAGLQDHAVESAAAFLRSGKGENAVMMGPMADVMFDSMRHLTQADARAMATYLTSVPEREVSESTHLIPLSEADTEEAVEAGRPIYKDNCAECHGDDGQGPDGVVSLVGNPTVTMDDPTNLIRMIRRGGFSASTEGNPRPHGMPPFQQFDAHELAAVASYIRRSWGNEAPAVSPIDVPE